MNDIHLFKHNNKDMLFHIPTSLFFEVKNGLFEKLTLNIENNEQVNEVLKFLSGTPPMKDSRALNMNKLTRLTLLSAQTCNLRCKYCFAGKGSYGENEKVIMPLEIYKEGLNYALRKYPEGMRMIQFFGGEPLLGFNEIREFLSYCKDTFRDRGIKIPTFSIVTNGTVFSEEIIELLNNYNVAVTISIDGPKIITDFARISEGGWSVYDRVVENIRRINSIRKFPLLVEVTLSKRHLNEYSAGKAKEWMTEIDNMGFDGGIIGVVESQDENLAFDLEDEDAYKQMYKEISDYWFERLCQEKAFCNFDILGVIKILGKKQKVKYPCGAGSTNITITAKGDILPCYILYGHKDFDMGNVLNPNTGHFEETRNVFMNIENKKPEECEKCWLKNICTIWCRAFGYTMRMDMKTVSLPRCWTAHAITESVISNLAEVTKQKAKYEQLVRNVMHFSKAYNKDA